VVLPGDFAPVFRAFSAPTNRVGVWVMSIEPPGDGIALPALDIQVRKGADMNGADDVVATVSKGLATLENAPFDFEVKGESATEWMLWARVSGPTARPIRIGFALLSGRVKCCARTITTL
jgi:hypothetical protein